MNSAVEGTFIAFSTADNSVADDNANEANGLFTKHLLSALNTAGLDLKQVFEKTKEAVYAASDHRQRPYTYDGVIGQYYFNAPVTVVNNKVSVDFSAQEEIGFWNGVDKTDAESLELYLKRYPEGSFVSLARRNLEKLRAPFGDQSTVGMAAPVPQTSAGTVKTNPKDGQRYVWIPPENRRRLFGSRGTGETDFNQGCSEGDTECFDEEKPAHRVEFTKGFWLGQTPVTVEAWKRYAQASGQSMPPEPRFDDRPLNVRWLDEQQPMVEINWTDASDYCKQAGGRLPTEAEWEYAGRAGSRKSRYGNLDSIAWYADNSGNAPIASADLKDYGARLRANGNGLHAVAQKTPNDWKLYDMLGNVWQWTADWYNEKYYLLQETKDPQGVARGSVRAVRGGSWYSISRFVRVSYRFGRTPLFRDFATGVRCLLE